MLLNQLLDQYLSERETCPLYAAQLRHRLAHFIAATGLKDCCEVTIEVVNAWLLATPGKAITRRGYRQCLLSILNYAADIGLMIRLDARRVRRPKIVYECPHAYSVAEIGALLDAASRRFGDYNWGVSRARYWQAMVAAGYDSGLRRGDLWTLPRSLMDETIFITQHKTGGIVVTGFRPDTLALMLALPGEFPLAWRNNLREFSREYRRLANLAGVKGSFRWIRRTSGSLAGQEHLGQHSSAVFYRHYRDPRVSPMPPLPPQIKMAGQNTRP